MHGAVHGAAFFHAWCSPWCTFEPRRYSPQASGFKSGFRHTVGFEDRCIVFVALNKNGSVGAEECESYPSMGRLVSQWALVVG